MKAHAQETPKVERYEVESGRGYGNSRAGESRGDRCNGGLRERRVGVTAGQRVGSYRARRSLTPCSRRLKQDLSPSCPLGSRGRVWIVPQERE